MSATFSPCGRYRYDFVDRWRPGQLLVVIGQNPSTAGQILCPGCIACLEQAAEKSKRMGFV